MSVNWTDVSAEFKATNVFMDIIGLENSGKTSLALSAPGPIGIAHNSEKVKGIVEKRVAGRSPFKSAAKVHQLCYGFVPTGDVAKDIRTAAPVWQGVRKAYSESLRAHRSHIFDTGNNFWEMARYGTFGTATPKGNRMDALYGPINSEVRGMLQTEFRAQGRCNVITIHQMGDKYVDKMVQGQMTSIKTGKLERKGGFKEVPYIADVIVRCFREEDTRAFKAVIEKGWVNPSVEGMELDDDTLQTLGYSGLNFSSIMAFITETPESHWSK